MIAQIPLDEVVHFDVVTHHPSTQAVTDADSPPTFEVFEEATDTDIGVGGSLTKRTSKTGDYRGTFTASTANGFEVGKFYSVVVSATVNAIAAKKVAAMFRVMAAEGTAGTPAVDVTRISNDATAADNAELFFDGTGYVPVGPATLANQTLMLALLNGSPIVVRNAKRNDNLLDPVVRGDTYDDTYQLAWRWPVTKDYTDGWTGELIIRHRTSGEALATLAVEVESDESLMVAPDGADLLFTDLALCEYGRHPFTLTMTKASKHETIVPDGIAVLYYRNL